MIAYLKSNKKNIADFAVFTLASCVFVGAVRFTAHAVAAAFEK